MTIYNKVKHGNNLKHVFLGKDIFVEKYMFLFF